LSEGESTFRPLIIVITFLGILVFLIGVILAESPELFIGSEQYREVSVPEHFESIDVLYYVERANFTLTSDMNGYPFDMGGWHFEMWTNADWSGYEIAITRGDFWFIFSYGWHNLIFEDLGRKDISSYYYYSPFLSCETIDKYWDYSDNATKIIVKDDTMQFHAFFNYNHETYDNCSDALSNDALEFMGCLEFDQQNTGMNVWSILGSLLFFRLPFVHPLINGILAIPIWICIVWLIAQFVYMVIKALPFT